MGLIKSPADGQVRSDMDKGRFLEKMRMERGRWEALLARVGEELGREAPGIAGDWSLKDLMAHVTAYERGLVKWLEGAGRGEAVTFPDLDHPDLDYRNALILAASRSRSWEEVEGEAAAVFDRLLALVAGLSEEELTDSELSEWYVRPRWGEARPLWRCIADDSYRHYQQHIPDLEAIVAERGRREP
jgi:hypothetical protein